MIVVAAQVRNGGTWVTKCIEKIIGKPVLHQPFEGFGYHSDSVMEPLPPEALIVEGADVCREIEFFSGCEAPPEIGGPFGVVVRKYMQHRADAGGLRVTCNLPDVVKAIGIDNAVVLHVVRNPVDAVLSTWQHWTYHNWIRPRIDGERSRWNEEPGWGEVDKMAGASRVLAERLMTMWCTSRAWNRWMASQPGLRWLTVSMERLSASPAYAAPQLAELLMAEASNVAEVFGSAREPVFSYPTLRKAGEIRMVEQIADQLGIQRM